MQSDGLLRSNFLAPDLVSELPKTGKFPLVKFSKIFEKALKSHYICEGRNHFDNIQNSPLEESKNFTSPPIKYLANLWESYQRYSEKATPDCYSHLGEDALDDLYEVEWHDVYRFSGKDELNKVYFIDPNNYSFIPDSNSNLNFKHSLSVAYFCDSCLIKDAKYSEIEEIYLMEYSYWDVTIDGINHIVSTTYAKENLNKCTWVDHYTDEELTPVHEHGEVVHSICANHLDTAIGYEEIWDSSETEGTSEPYYSIMTDVIQPYGWKPEWLCSIIDPKDQTKITKVYDFPRETFGFELETDQTQSNRKKLAHQMTKKFEEMNAVEMFFTNDGTCSGFEITSHPFTFDAFRISDFSFFESLRDEGMRSYHGEDCGIHVHVSRSGFNGQYHLYKFQKFFYFNPNFIWWISQRKLKRLKAWGNPFAYEGLTSKDQWSGQDKVVYKTKDIAKSGTGGFGRTTAINCEPENTVEVRVFRGTLFEPSFRKNIEFTKAVLDFTRDQSGTDISPKKFVELVETRKKEFPHLFNWFNERGCYDEEENPMVNYHSEYAESELIQHETSKYESQVEALIQEKWALRDKFEDLKHDKPSDIPINKYARFQWTLEMDRINEELSSLTQEIGKLKNEKVDFPDLSQLGNHFLKRDGGVSRHQMSNILRRTDIGNESFTEQET